MHFIHNFSLPVQSACWTPILLVTELVSDVLASVVLALFFLSFAKHVREHMFCKR
jgi:hypothetical protein